MTHFRIQELKALESGAGNPRALRERIGEMILGSKACRAKIEAINTETGEYRLILQGTLEREESPLKENPWNSK